MFVHSNYHSFVLFSYTLRAKADKVKVFSAVLLCEYVNFG